MKAVARSDKPTQSCRPAYCLAGQLQIDTVTVTTSCVT